MSTSSGKWLDPLLVALFAFGLVWVFGPVAWMPLDQSIAFDGAVRMLAGQRPFVDFTAPAHLLPAMLTVPFFRLLGVGWAPYLLHAALANVGFGLLGWWMCRALFPGRRAWALLAGAALGVCGYPPFGVPYGDQHSFLITLAGLAALLRAERALDRGGLLALASLPPLLLAGWLAKPIPVVLLPFAWALTAAAVPALRSRRALGALAAGAGLSLIALLLLPGAVGYHLLHLPFAEGGGRLERYLAPGLGTELILTVALGGLLSPFALPVLVAWAAPGAAGFHPLRVEPWLRYALLACLGSLGFMLLTRNQEANGVVLLALAGVLCGAAASAKLSPRAGHALLGLLALDLALFGVNVVARRTVHDLSFEGEAWSAAPVLSGALWPLRYATSPELAVPSRDLLSLVDVLRGAERPLLLADSLIALGLAGHVNPTPWLWLHPGLAIPTPDPEDAEAQRLHALHRQLLDPAEGIDLVVFRRGGSMLGVDPGDFPGFAEALSARACGQRELGPWQLVSLRGANGGCRDPLPPGARP